MATHKSSLVHPKYKTKYRVGNWSEYERGLRSRGERIADTNGFPLGGAAAAAADGGSVRRRGPGGGAAWRPLEPGGLVVEVIENAPDDRWVGDHGNRPPPQPPQAENR